MASKYHRQLRMDFSYNLIFHIFTYIYNNNIPFMVSYILIILATCELKGETFKRIICIRKSLSVSIHILLRNAGIAFVLRFSAMDSRINPSPPSAACMRRWTGSGLVQIMACRLFGAKPLLKPMLTYCHLDHVYWQTVSMPCVRLLQNAKLRTPLFD